MFGKNKYLLIIPFVIFLAALGLFGCTQDKQADQVSVVETEEDDADVAEEIQEESGEADEAEKDNESMQDETAEDVNTEGYNNDFTLLDLDENEVSLSDYAGKIVVINFWATWCNPCEMEIPDFVEVYEEYKGKGVEFLGVSNDNVDSLKQFVEEYGIQYPVLVDGSIDSISSYWRISAIPTTYIVDGSGNAVFRQIGLMTKNQLINAIEEQI